MAEKWDDRANDSPEVVYDGFSPTTTQPQGLPPSTTPSQALPPPHPAFVGEGDGTVSLGGPSGPASFITDTQQQQLQQQQDGEVAAVADRGQLCFVCCGSVADSNYKSVRSSMNHSHAPLLVLLTEVLGYKLDTGQLHSEVVCKNCYRLLDIIDELHQTLTESKTDVRTKFLETIQRLRLKYPRTDKMLKPRCLRCVQMSQSSARRRGRGRGWKGRVEDTRGRGKGGRGRGRGATRTEDGNDLGSDNDLEGGRDSRDGLCKVPPPPNHHNHHYRHSPHHGITTRGHMGFPHGDRRDQTEANGWVMVDGLDGVANVEEDFTYGSGDGEFDTLEEEEEERYYDNMYLDFYECHGVRARGLRLLCEVCMGHLGTLLPPAGPQNTNGCCAVEVTLHKPPGEGLWVWSRGVKLESVNPPSDTGTKAVKTCSSVGLMNGDAVINAAMSCATHTAPQVSSSDAVMLHTMSSEPSNSSSEVMLSRTSSSISSGATMLPVCSRDRTLSLPVSTSTPESLISINSPLPAFPVSLSDVMLPVSTANTTTLPVSSISSLDCLISMNYTMTKLPLSTSLISTSRNAVASVSARDTVPHVSGTDLLLHSLGQEGKGSEMVKECDGNVNGEVNMPSPSSESLVLGSHIPSLSTPSPSLSIPPSLSSPPTSLSTPPPLSSPPSLILSSPTPALSTPSPLSSPPTSLSTPQTVVLTTPPLSTPPMALSSHSPLSLPPVSTTRLSYFDMKDYMDTPVSKDVIIPPVVPPVNTQPHRTPPPTTKSHSPFSPQHLTLLSPDPLTAKPDSHNSNISEKFTRKNFSVSSSVEVQVSSLPSAAAPTVLKMQHTPEDSKGQRKGQDTGTSKKASDTFQDLPLAALGKRRRKPSEKARNAQISRSSTRPGKFPRTKVPQEDAQQSGDPVSRQEEAQYKFVCEYCGRKFSSATGFRYHVGSHGVGAGVTFTCDLCPYTTRRASDLKKHQVTHTGERPHRCPVCSQEFSVNSSFRRHLRVHSGERPHVCPSCPMAFRSPATLRQHMVRHTGARDYVCEVCGSSFILRHHYTLHRRLHNEELPFTCTHCTSSFRHHSALRQHRRKAHPREEAARLQQTKLRHLVVKGNLQGTPTPVPVPAPPPPPPLPHHPFEEILQEDLVSEDSAACVDSCTQTLPSPSSPSSSITQGKAKGQKDTPIVLTISTLGTTSHTGHTKMQELPKDSKDTIGLQEKDTCANPDFSYPTIEILPDPIAESLSIPEKYLVVKEEEVVGGNGDFSSSSSSSTSSSIPSQVYIVLPEADDCASHLYIVMGEHIPTSLSQ
ncbi:uncharacterized protein LOC123518773 isoform X2 [Portunus trituberculatus]|uniref:uncharacterized protein LOC123518773 isoform X2 n=1 Tax=Portunus trituberculatus TaxID=210409 RepID=UPI001E1CD34B|nr:uncharacterized protein LOC123518773 isoform X2 [Portunus trituberculatus]